MNLLARVKQVELEAEEFGFKWSNPDQIMDQILSECAEIKEHLNDFEDIQRRERLEEEIGDLLHAVFSLCIFCRFNPEETLKFTVNKFERRLQAVKKIAQQQHFNNLRGHSFAELMKIWDQAKKEVG